MRRASWILGLFVLAAAPARPDVADSAKNGFTVKVTLIIQGTADAVWRKLIAIGDWWNPAHTFSGDARNLILDPKAGGCLCERLPNNGGVRHMEVVFAAPGKSLVLRGALGPLQSIAATGSMKIQIAPAELGTRLEVTYSVAGYLPAAMDTFAAPVDSVVTEQFTRLQNLVEHGAPAPK